VGHYYWQGSYRFAKIKFKDFQVLFQVLSPFQGFQGPTSTNPQSQYVKRCPIFFSNIKAIPSKELNIMEKAAKF